MIKLACLMMVKNEELRILVTLNTLINIIDVLIIYDTGSTDDTVLKIELFCEQNNIKLCLKHGTFKDFAISRNDSLDFADSVSEELNIDFLLLLDCNDELKDGDKLLSFLNNNNDEHKTAFLLCQEWYSGSYTKYYNIRLIRPKENWRYNGRVHEWIQKKDHPEVYITERIPDVKIFQDRVKDDDKSSKRFKRDKILLLEDHKENPTNGRITFYLAQTFGCLGDHVNAYKYYSIRVTLGEFMEEIFHSYLRLGEIIVNCIKDENLRNNNKEILPLCTWDRAIQFFMKSLEYLVRVEPLLYIAEYYRSLAKWDLAFMYCRLACELKNPEDHMLFVDHFKYDYSRWHLMGIIGYYSGHLREGYDSCKIAIQVCNLDIDKQNLKYYENILFRQLNNPN